MQAVPFKYDNDWAGFVTSRGLVSDAGDHLLVEFQTRDSFFGVPLGGVRSVTVPIADLVSVELTPGLFGLGGKLVLRSNRLGTLAALPGMSQGRVELGVERRDLAAAEAFVARLHPTDDGRSPVPTS